MIQTRLELGANTVAAKWFKQIAIEEKTFHNLHTEKKPFWQEPV